MKTSVLALALVGAASAYPNIARYVEEQKALKTRQQPAAPAVPFPYYAGVPRAPGSVPFSEELQFVSTSGIHAWVAPLPTDQRGPCPGLNAAANHGYLPHDGIATLVTLNTGLFEAFGLGQDSTQFLQQTTAFFDGDPFAQRWSIGGFSNKTYFGGNPDGSSQGPLGPLGQQSGICAYGHLKSESDASITRGDFLAPVDDDNCKSYPKFFQQLMDSSCAATAADDPDHCNISAATLAAHQHERKLYSIATNPNAFFPAFAGVAFTPAAHTFVSALMSNHSAEFPSGILTPSDLMDFFSYKYAADGKTLIYTYGHEKIPEDWYKRHPTDPWSVNDIVTAVAQQCASYPATCQVGGNTNGVNTFAGISPADISGGVFTSAAYTDPKILGCFLSQNIQAEAPDSLNNVFQGPELQLALELVTSRLIPGLAQAFGECNGLNVKGGTGQPGLTMSQYAPESKFPGAKRQKFNKGPRAESPRP